MESFALPTLLKVLIVEDEERQMEITRRSLETHGTFQLSFARNAAEAFQRLNQEVPDLMLLDLESSRRRRTGCLPPAEGRGTVPLDSGDHPHRPFDRRR